MSEILNSEQEPARPIVPPETAEFLEHHLAETEKKNSRINLNQEGIDKAASQMYAKAREVRMNDSESETHMEAGIPLPKAASHDQVIENINKLLYSADADPFDAVNYLAEHQNSSDQG